MQAHTLFELSAYSSTSDSTYGDAQSPIDLLSPSHLIVDATIRIESGIQPCDGYPSWVAFTGKITQNVAQETHVLFFFAHTNFPSRCFRWSLPSTKASETLQTWFLTWKWINSSRPVLPFAFLTMWRKTPLTVILSPRPPQVIFPDDFRSLGFSMWYH